MVLYPSLDGILALVLSTLQYQVAEDLPFRNANRAFLVFGIFIDVPLLAGTFLLMLVYRRPATNALVRTPLPSFLLYLLLVVPLIIFEEQIDCQPAWCGQVLIPPTLPFLVLEMVLIGAIVITSHAKNVLRITLISSVYGVLFELLIGGLAGAPLLIAALLAPYVALGYAYISMLPLRVLIIGRGSQRTETAPLAKQSSSGELIRLA